MRGKRRLTLAVAIVAVSCVAVGIAYAAGGIPGSDGTIQGCYDSGGNLKVVAALPCPKGYTSLPWGQQGPAGKDGKNGVDGKDGKDGVNGASPTVTQLLPMDSHCAAGGAAITDAAGSTAYVCSGQNGQDGQSFAGTFTSPNGQFSLKVTDAGVEIKGPDSTITLPSGGGVNVTSTGRLVTRVNDELVHVDRDRDVEVLRNETHYVAHDRVTAVDHDESILVRHNRTETVDNDQTTSIHGDRAETVDVGASLVAGGTLDVQVGGGLSVQADGTLGMQASGALSVAGSSVNINGGSSCPAAARKGDQVNTASAISTGSATVCIG